MPLLTQQPVWYPNYVVRAILDHILYEIFIITMTQSYISH